MYHQRTGPLRTFDLKEGKMNNMFTFKNHTFPIRFLRNEQADLIFKDRSYDTIATLKFFSDKISW